MTIINIKNPSITINKERQYTVELIDESSGELILKLEGNVVKKIQPKGITGFGDVKESLFIKDWKITIGKQFKVE